MIHTNPLSCYYGQLGYAYSVDEDIRYMVLDKGSLFGLYPRGINLINLSTEHVQLALPLLYITSFVISFHVRVCMLATRFSMHAFDSNLSKHVCLSLHATWHSSHHSLESF